MKQKIKNFARFPKLNTITSNSPCYKIVIPKIVNKKE